MTGKRRGVDRGGPLGAGLAGPAPSPNATPVFDAGSPHDISGGKQRYCRARHRFSGGGAGTEFYEVGDEKLAKERKTP